MLHTRAHGVQETKDQYGPRIDIDGSCVPAARSGTRNRRAPIGATVLAMETGVHSPQRRMILGGNGATLPQFFLDLVPLSELSGYASHLSRVGSMKLLTGLLAAMLLLAGASTSLAEIRIAGDQGGQIGRYVDRYEQLRASGQTIIIDGLCASACTIVLGTIPHDKICVTPNANLAFHAAWDLGADGRSIANRGATRTLYSLYPLQVRHWIDSQGGLTPHMIYLRGRQLEAMYRPCHLSAQVTASR